MTLPEKIHTDLIAAMKAREADKLGVLRMLKAALQNAALEKGGAEAVLDEAEAEAVIRRQAKQRQDSIAGFEKGNRPELAAREQGELEILRGYLPAGMTPAELQALVRAAIQETGATSKAQMGAVMKAAQAQAGGRVEGRALSAAVQQELAG